MNAVPSIMVPDIALDAVFFQLNNTGIARVWDEAMKAWSLSGFARRVLVLDRNEKAPRYEGFQYVQMPPYEAQHSGKDALKLQEVCDSFDIRAFISTYYTAPTRTRSAVFVYDMIGEILGLTRDSREFAEKELGILSASRFLALSRQSRDDLVQFHPWIDAFSVGVAYCAASSVFRPAERSEIDAFLQQRSLEKPYVLVVGERLGVTGYKNIPQVFRALGTLPEAERSALDVVCVGGKPDLEPELSELTSGFNVLQMRLTDEELRLAYAGAVALIYPSRYEGFGMPVAEAMATGCPVITTPLGSLPEVGGSAVVYVDPEDVAGMRDAIRKIQEPGCRARLIREGKAQAGTFSFRRMAEQVAGVLDELASSPLSLDDRRKGAEWEKLRHFQADRQSLDLESRAAAKKLASAQKQVERLQKTVEKLEVRLAKQGEKQQLSKAGRWLSRMFWRR